jgi:hypothetical protein
MTPKNSGTVLHTPLNNHRTQQLEEVFEKITMKTEIVNKKCK